MPHKYKKMEAGGEIAIKTDAKRPQAKPSSDIGKASPLRMKKGGEVKRMQMGGITSLVRPTMPSAAPMMPGLRPRMPAMGGSMANSMQMYGRGAIGPGKDTASRAAAAPVMRGAQRMKGGGSIMDQLVKASPHRLLGLPSILDAYLHPNGPYTDLKEDYESGNMYRTKRMTPAKGSGASPTGHLIDMMRGKSGGYVSGGKPVMRKKTGGYVHGGKPPKRKRK